MITAVEWLYEALIQDPTTEAHFKYNERCWEQAKAMEEESKKDYDFYKSYWEVRNKKK